MMNVLNGSNASRRFFRQNGKSLNSSFSKDNLRMPQIRWGVLQSFFISERKLLRMISSKEKWKT